MQKLWWILLFAFLLFLWYYRETIAMDIEVVRSKLRHKVNYSYVNTDKPHVIPAWYTQKIPFKIHQTSFSRKMDYRLANASLLNHYVNPEYDYYFYDEAACVDFIAKNYPEYRKHYDVLIPGAYKADLFRLLVLYHSGGVYIDDKAFSIHPLREFIREDDEMILIKDNMPGQIYQGVVYSIPGHPLMKQLIDKYISNIDARHYGVDPYDIGGPKMFGRVVNTYLGRPEDTVFTSLQKDGIRVDAGTSFLNGSDDVVLSDDKKTIFFERGNKAYMKRKITQFFNGKEYHTLWIRRKVYKDKKI
jgi:hypothetical protein